MNPGQHMELEVQLEESLFAPEFSPLSPAFASGHAFTEAGHAYVCFLVFDTFLTTPHPEFRICIKCWQAADILLIKYDHLGIVRLKKKFLMGHNS